MWWMWNLPWDGGRVLFGAVSLGDENETKNMYIGYNIEFVIDHIIREEREHEW